MKRRQFIAGLGSAAAWPVVARAQQPDRMRRIGVVLTFVENDPEVKRWLSAFTQGLAELGWTTERNLRIDYRWGASSADLRRKFAAELVALKPDVIFANAGPVVEALQEASRTVPIVFAATIDPVGGGYVESLSRPGGNATGFLYFEYSMAAKWLELLKEIAPGVTRVAVLRNPTVTSGTGQFGVIQAMAPSIRVEVIPINVRDANARDADEIVRAVAAFARAPNGGLIVTAGTAGTTEFHRGLIITLAARHKLPAVYYERFFVTAGGLISYGADQTDLYRRAASYVDRILKGEKPSDLPVQAPTKFETVLNMKTAKALGLTIPETLLATADEVIQ
jgi:putative tryptophan/tyrosine transport system substrate-binding protein